VDVVLQACSTILIYAVTLVIVAWTAGALYYDVGRASRLSWLLVLVWVASVVVAYVMWQPPWKAFLLVLAIQSLFLAWWFSQKPSNQRNWEPNDAVLARLVIQGDVVTIENVRNTEYRTFQDYTPKHETHTYHLSRLKAVDAVICYWGSPWMCHPMFVFDFGPDGRVCISIEVRYRVGQDYNLMRSLYRQQELIYIVCDERDAILRRTKYYEGNDVYLYRIAADEDETRKFFAEYCERINALIDSPRWYHGLTANCTTSIYMQRRRNMAWDWRLLFNGSLDRMMYKRKRLDQSRPFETLRQQSLVNEIANRAPRENFGDYIRLHLPGYNAGPANGSSTLDDSPQAPSPAP
jgi:uncharacterized protein DUF4105